MNLAQAILRGHERRGTSNMWTLYDFAGYAGKPTTAYAQYWWPETQLFVLDKMLIHD